MKELIILNLLLILFLIIYLNNCNFNIIYLNKYELALILKNDNDNFYKNISNDNLNLRNINDKKLFLNNIHNYLYTINKNEKCIINKAIKKANNKLKKCNLIGFNYNKMENYPWIIGFSIGEQYEFGYPHTRNNIIILNYNNIYDKDLVNTLIHERIHIYQKLYPHDINLFLNLFNFKKIKIKENYHLHNPDTDLFIYKKNNIIFECKIINNKLEYSHKKTYYEHPYEFMAYLLVELIS